jgi:hypothetical protein
MAAMIEYHIRGPHEAGWAFVHFSGHGTRNHEILLEDKNGFDEPVGKERGKFCLAFSLP